MASRTVVTATASALFVLLHCYSYRRGIFVLVLFWHLRLILFKYLALSKVVAIRLTSAPFRSTTPLKLNYVLWPRTNQQAGTALRVINVEILPLDAI